MLALERKWYPQSTGCSSYSVKRSLKSGKRNSGEFLFKNFISYRQFNLYNYKSDINLFHKFWIILIKKIANWLMMESLIQDKIKHKRNL